MPGPLDRLMLLVYVPLLTISLARYLPSNNLALCIQYLTPYVLFAGVGAQLLWSVHRYSTIERATKDAGDEGCRYVGVVEEVITSIGNLELLCWNIGGTVQCMMYAGILKPLHNSSIPALLVSQFLIFSHLAPIACILSHTFRSRKIPAYYLLAFMALLYVAALLLNVLCSQYTPLARLITIPNLKLALEALSARTLLVDVICVGVYLGMTRGGERWLGEEMSEDLIVGTACSTLYLGFLFLIIHVPALLPEYYSTLVAKAPLLPLQLFPRILFGGLLVALRPRMMVNRVLCASGSELEGVEEWKETQFAEQV